MADNPKITQIKVGNTTYDVSDSTAVQKSGDTMTGDLVMNANISLGADKNINLANGDKIIFGGTEAVGSTFEIKTVHQPTGSEHIISMAKVGGLTDSCIKFIEKTNMPEMCATGYHQLPVNDGSSASNYYTLATVEKSIQKSGGSMTGNLYFDGGNLFLYDPNSLDYRMGYIDFSGSGNVKLSTPDGDTLVANVYGANGGFEVTYSGHEIYLAPTNSDGNQIWSKLSENNYISRFKLPDVNATETLATREWVTDNVSIRIYDYTDF